MLVVVAVARLLGPEGLGNYAFVIGVSSLFVPLMDLGLNNRTIKSVASGLDEGRLAVADAVGFRLATAPAALALMGAAGWALGKSSEVIVALLLIGSSAVLMGLGDALNSVFKGLRRPVFGVFLVGGLNLLLCGSGIWAMGSGYGLVGLAVCYAVCRALYVVAGMAAVSVFASEFRPRMRPRAGVSFVKHGIAHLPSVTFLGNLLNLNFITLYVFLGETQAGFYAVGYRVAIALLVLISASMEAVLPELAVGREQMPLDRVRKWGIRLLGLSIAVALVVTLAARPVALALFGDTYDASVPALSWLVWTLPSLTLCALFHTTLLAGDRPMSAAAAMLALIVAGTVFGGAAMALWGPFAMAMAPAVVGAFFAILLRRQIVARVTLAAPRREV